VGNEAEVKGEEWLPLVEAARRLQVHPQTVRRWVRQQTCRARCRRRGKGHYLFISTTEIERLMTLEPVVAAPRPRTEAQRKRAQADTDRYWANREKFKERLKEQRERS
jgi:transposase-like protein